MLPHLVVLVVAFNGFKLMVLKYRVVDLVVFLSGLVMSLVLVLEMVLVVIVLPVVALVELLVIVVSVVILDSSISCSNRWWYK